MQNTHYGALRVIHTALTALSHTLKILFEHRSLQPQKLLLLPKQSLCLRAFLIFLGRSSH